MQIIVYIIVGFFAQMIDGMLGMAYGVSCRTFLLTISNLPSSVISATIHYAEIPTSFVSMISHIKLKNFDKKLFFKLVIPGVIGSVIGAYIISFDFSFMEVFVDLYLILMGVLVLSKGLMNKGKETNRKNIFYYIIGFIGAFFDSAGGGGYGPIVTGSLMANTNTPKKVIGTVNSSEFFVTLFSSITFLILMVNIKNQIYSIVGLIIGGIIAAPVAAKLCNKIKDKKLFIFVGALLIILNVYNIIKLIID